MAEHFAHVVRGSGPGVRLVAARHRVVVEARDEWLAAIRSLLTRVG
jgi:hypothetical protein